MATTIPIQVNNLDDSKTLPVTIRRDWKTPGRIFCEFPKYASLTPDQAITMANRLADLLEK